MAAASLLSLLLAAQVGGDPVARATYPCPTGTTSALLVEVTGFRNRAGTVRVRLFGGATSTYFDKKRALARIQIPVPPRGPVAICVPAPRPGVYAVDVRHDGNANGDTDRSDGGGASGNPRVSLFDVLFSRKPDPKRVQVRAGAGTTVVPVTLMYLQGGSFKPLRTGS